MTSPAADKTPKNQRGQDRQSKKDKPSINESLLEGVHGFGGLNRGNCFARHPPLDEMSDHKQVEEDKSQSSPAARLGLANPGRPIGGMFAGGGGNHSLGLQFSIYTTAFHYTFDLHHSAEVDPGTLEGYLELEYSPEF